MPKQVPVYRWAKNEACVSEQMGQGTTAHHCLLREGGRWQRQMEMNHWGRLMALGLPQRTMTWVPSTTGTYSLPALGARSLKSGCVKSVLPQRVLWKILSSLPPSGGSNLSSIFASISAWAQPFPLLVSSPLSLRRTSVIGYLGSTQITQGHLVWRSLI